MESTTMHSWITFCFFFLTFPFSIIANPTYAPYSALALFPLTPSDIVDPNLFSRDHEGSLKFMMSFKETVYCRTEERLGKVGDGGKWVCHPRVLLKQPNCVVYSLGSRGDFSFEMAIYEIAPNCEIHTFDPTPGIKIPESLPKNIKFHPLGVAAKGIDFITLKKTKVPTKSLGEIMQKLGHTSLALLKMDIEGSEYGNGFFEVTKDSGWRSIAQLDIEIHCYGSHNFEATKQLFTNLTDLGLELFHREVNPYRKALFEYAFLNPMLMDRVAKVPYSEDMLKTAETALIEPLLSFRSPGNLNRMRRKKPGPKSLFYIDEPHYFHCRVMEPLPGDKFNRYCSSHFQDYQSSDKEPVVLVFVDRASPVSYQWLPGLHKTLPSTTQFHVWMPTDTIAPSPPEDGTFSRYSFHDLNSVKTRKYNSSNAVDLDKVFESISFQNKWVSLIIFEVGNGFENLGTLAGQVMKYKIPTFPPIQVLVDVSFCESDHESQFGWFVSHVIKLMSRAGFKMTSKDLQVHGYYPEECHYIFAYST